MARLRRALRRFVLPLLMTSGLLAFSCRSTTDLVLDDPAFLEDMVDMALAGERFTITPEDRPGIRRLLNDDDADHRRAGVLVAVQSGDPALIPDIVDAARDPDTAVAETALQAIREDPETYRPLLIDRIASMDPDERAGAVALLGESGGEDLVPLLIALFADPDPTVRDRASLAVHRLADRQNPFLREALESDDPLTAAIAIRTLGRYTDADDAPFFISAFASPVAGIRREAQLAALRLREAGLPFLHIEARDADRPYRTRLAAMDVVQGLRSPESLPVLMELLSDEDERIRVKAGSILGTYGAEAIPELARLFDESDPAIRIRVLQLMGEIGSHQSFPTLTRALDDPSAEVRLTAREVLTRFGSAAWPALRARIVEGGDIGRRNAVDLLRNAGDPDLAGLDTLKALVTESDREELETYVEKAGLGRLESESVLSLRDAWVLGEEFAELEAVVSSGRDPYLDAWRQWENAAVRAQELLKESFEEVHRYFETGEAAALERARILRDESRRLDDEARTLRNRMDALDPFFRNRGEARLTRYSELRDTLVRTWEYVIPEMRPVAAELYADRGLDPQALARRSALPN